MKGELLDFDFDECMFSEIFSEQLLSKLNVI